MPSSNADVPEAAATEAYDALQRNGEARLVDVRTKAEWNYVGVTDLSGTANEPILMEWQTFPSMAVNSDFGQALENACPDKNTPLYFLCRSGVRSLAAAREMSARGYTHVFNVTDGFEGPPDADGHRGNVAGWKAGGLPWRQT